MRVTAAAFLLLFACPAASRAQSLYRSEMVAAVALRPSSPPVSALSRPPADFLGARRFRSRAPGATLMIIGGGAIVAGALVGGSGGTILILGGVGVGAYGFYLYTR